MTWLGQKPEPQPIRPTQPTTAVHPPVAPTPTPIERVDTKEARRVASIGKSLHVRGEIRGNEDLAIEGKVEGKIDLNGHHVTIAQTGKVSAAIQAKSVDVGGLVEGDIQAAEKVEVGATGTMVGDIRAPRVVLVDGSRFKGSIDMETKSAPRAAVAAPSASLPTANPGVSWDDTPAYAGATKG